MRSGDFISLFERIEIAFDALPDDMQQLIYDLWVEVKGDDADLPALFAVRDIPLDAFPETRFTPGDRGPDHAMAMEDDLPPVIVSNGTWVDGRHRVYRAKKKGLQTIEALELGLDWGATGLAPNLGELRPYLSEQ